MLSNGNPPREKCYKGKNINYWANWQSWSLNGKLDKSTASMFLLAGVGN